MRLRAWHGGLVALGRRVCAPSLVAPGPQSIMLFLGGQTQASRDTLLGRGGSPLTAPRAYIAAMMSEPNSLHLRSVAPSIWR